MAALPALDTLRKHARHSRPKPVKGVSQAEFDNLLASLANARKRRRIDPDELSDLMTWVRKTTAKLKSIQHRQGRLVTRLYITRMRARQGAGLASSRDPARVLGWLLDRSQYKRNVHAMAQGKRTARKLGPEHYRRIGKQGAQARWHPENLALLRLWSVGCLFED